MGQRLCVHTQETLVKVSKPLGLACGLDRRCQTQGPGARTGPAQRSIWPTEQYKSCEFNFILVGFTSFPPSWPSFTTPKKLSNR